MHEWKATLPGRIHLPIVHFTLPEQKPSGHLEGAPSTVGGNRLVWQMSTSVQHLSTDTMATGTDGRPFMCMRMVHTHV